MTSLIPCNKSTYTFYHIINCNYLLPKVKILDKNYIKQKPTRRLYCISLVQHKPSRFLFYAILPLVIYDVLFISTYRPYQEQQEQLQQAL